MLIVKQRYAVAVAGLLLQAQSLVISHQGHLSFSIMDTQAAAETCIKTSKYIA